MCGKENGQRKKITIKLHIDDLKISFARRSIVEDMLIQKRKHTHHGVRKSIGILE